MGPIAGGLQALGASPPLAGDKADVIGLAVRVDPPCLPPLFIAGINYMQHIPKAEAQGLAQEATVLGLVVIKQGPGEQAAIDQGLAEDFGHPEPGLEVLGQWSTQSTVLVSLLQVPWILRNPKTVWRPKTQL